MKLHQNGTVFLMIRLPAKMAWIRQRTAACDEPFGCEPFGGELKVERLLVEKLRVERLSRVEYRMTKVGIALRGVGAKTPTSPLLS